MIANGLAHPSSSYFQNAVKSRRLNLGSRTIPQGGAGEALEDAHAHDLRGGVQEKDRAASARQIAVLLDGNVPITRHGKGSPGRLVEQTVDPAFRSGAYRIPTRYRIATDDGELRADLEVVAALSTSSTWVEESRARHSEAPTGEFLVDEQLLRVKMRFHTPEGEARSASGPREFMSTTRDR